MGGTGQRRARHDDIRRDQREQHGHGEAQPLACQRIRVENAASEVRHHDVDDDDAVAVVGSCALEFEVELDHRISRNAVRHTEVVTLTYFDSRPDKAAC